MELFLLRHGHAMANAPTDSERPLSDKGRADVRNNLAKVQHELAQVEAVWVSPYLRAQQTWDETKSYLANMPNMIAVDEITPDGNPLKVIKIIAAAKIKSLLIITHQPFVGDLLDYLCAFESGRHFLGTADIVAVDLPDVDAGEGNLRWHIKVGT